MAKAEPEFKMPAVNDELLIIPPEGIGYIYRGKVVTTSPQKQAVIQLKDASLQLASFEKVDMDGTVWSSAHSIVSARHYLADGQVQPTYYILIK